MAVRSKQLARAHFSDTATHDLYVVPTGYRTIVKSISLQTSATAANRVVFSVLEGASTVFVFVIWLGAASADGETKLVQMWLVLAENQKLTVSFTSTGGWVLLSGAELLL